MNARLDGKNESTSRLVTTTRARAFLSTSLTLSPRSTTEGPNRRPRDRIDDRGTESTIARANHTECDDFHARCVDRVTQNVRIARNVRSFTSSRVRRVRRVRRGLPRASSCTSFISFHSRAACIRRAAARVGVTDTHTTTSHDSSYHFSCLFPPQTGKKKNQNIEKHTRRAWGGVHTSHDPIERERESRARAVQKCPRARSRGNETHKSMPVGGDSMTGHASSIQTHPDPPPRPAGPSAGASSPHPPHDESALLESPHDESRLVTPRPPVVVRPSPRLSLSSSSRVVT